jgi:hypothetical protein
MSATDSQQLIVRQIFEKRDDARFDLSALRNENLGQLVTPLILWRSHIYLQANALLRPFGPQRPKRQW